MKRFAFKTLGCKVNQYETEAMEELFLQRGYEKAESEEETDVYVVNTCTVTSASDAKSRQQINRIKRKNPGAIVAVVGCYAQVAPEEIEALENVDIILGTKGRAKLVDLVESVQEGGDPIIRVNDLEDDRTFDDLEISTELAKTRATIKIQEGCDMFCTYCIIPYARGHIASRPLPSIAEEVERLAAKGFKEFVLTGIHVASYGKDQGGELDLLDVIEAISKIDGVDRIRLSSMEPRWVTEEKLARLKQIPQFCDHFHLSLQSGSDQILQAMNRKYDTALFKEKVDLIRQFYPACGITTDVIVGFPGETEEDFQETADFVREVQFSKIHIFPYSAREGTPAADFDGAVDPQVKKERAQRLSEIEEEMRFAFLDAHIGQTGQVLFEEEEGNDGLMYGYTSNYLRVEAEYDPNKVNVVLPVTFVSRDGDKLLVEFPVQEG